MFGQDGLFRSLEVVDGADALDDVYSVKERPKGHQTIERTPKRHSSNIFRKKRCPILYVFQVEEVSKRIDKFAVIEQLFYCSFIHPDRLCYFFRRR